MSGTVILMSQLKHILRLISQSHGLKTIVRQTGVSRNTIKSYLRILQGKEISIEEALKLEDPQLSHLLRSPPNTRSNGIRIFFLVWNILMKRERSHMLPNNCCGKNINQRTLKDISTPAFVITCNCMTVAKTQY